MRERILIDMNPTITVELTPQEVNALLRAIAPSVVVDAPERDLPNPDLVSAREKILAEQDHFYS